MTDDEVYGPALAAAYGLSGEMLAANRSGRLHAAQITRLLWPGMKAVVISVGLVGLVILCVMVSAGVERDPPDSSPTANGQLLLLPIAAVILSGLAAASLWRAGCVAADLVFRRVRMIRGVVAKTSVALEGRPPALYYVMDKRKFRVSTAAFAALAAGEVHCVYCTRYSGILVGIERAGAGSV